jgi:GNAT superfamily N-acetyltransferase
MSVTLRAAGEGDERFLFELYASTRREEIAAWNWPEAQVTAFLEMQFRAQRFSYQDVYPGSEHSLVLEDGRPVGRLLVWRSDKEVRLVDISLLPAARGRGIGSRLIRRLIDECAGKRLTLQVLTTNPARRLYLRLGFRRTGGDPMYDQMEWTSSGSEEPA